MQIEQANQLIEAQLLFIRTFSSQLPFKPAISSLLLTTAPKFDVTPQKEGSLPSYLHRQLFFTPQPVAGVSVEGKTAIVTGSNCGVGLECSRQLLDLGITTLVLAVRSQVRG